MAEQNNDSAKKYDPYREDVQKRIRKDLAEIRSLGREIITAVKSAEKLLDAGKVDPWEWEQRMNKIHDARKKIRWIICEKRGRFV
jgi:hypothetical protein